MIFNNIIEKKIRKNGLQKDKEMQYIKRGKYAINLIYCMIEVQNSAYKQVET